MADLVRLHLLDDGAAARIVRRQSFEMGRQVALDLPLGFRHEPEARPVAEQPCQCADDDGARVPERVQEARPRAQLVEPVPAPGQVVAFLGGGPTHGVLRALALGWYRL